MKTFLKIVLMLALLITPWQPAAASARHKAVCSHRPKAGSARCDAQVVTDGTGHPLVSAQPQGYTPAQFHAAYALPTGGRATVGVVVAYDDPDIKSDLDNYSRTFGLPVMPTCVSAGQQGCFEKRDQHGGRNYPKADSGWALEASLDVETVHGICSGCRIELVEAVTPSLADLGAAVDTAAELGARIVSNSYGGPESAAETGMDTHYRHAGVTVVASSGDSGYGVNYPAASQFVVAVGGTKLGFAGGQPSETAWTAAGSGCSQYEPKPSWQHDPSCSRRTVADVAADADPSTGAAIYSSYGGRSGWYTVGGTSLAAPLVAGAFGLAAGGSAASLYAHAGSLRDIVSGHNARCGSYLCVSGSGYDGPTGLGSPRGLAAF